MDSPTEMEKDIPIEIRTREKLVIYVVWEVTVDTDTRIIEVNGAVKHVPDYEYEDTDNDTDRNTIIGRMRETELVLLGAMQPKDYVIDVVFAPENSIVIIDGEKYTKCGVVTENHAIISNNYVVENVSETPCPTYKELAEMAIHLKALNYRLNAFTYKYDLIVLTILLKNNLIQLG